MHIAQMRQFDVSNGTGIRTTLFVSGCTHNCKNCFNKEYQNFTYGREWTPEVEQEFINLAKNEQIAGVSILGGEPLQQPPLTLYKLLKRIKEETGKNIWLWTGYEYENIPKPHLPSLEYIDVLVDGKFIEEEKDLTLKFRGSRNQRLIDVKKTLAHGSVVLYDL